jgi:L-gulonolactone oxidase
MSSSRARGSAAAKPWRNWAGNHVVTPREVAQPCDPTAVAAVIRRAIADRRRVRAVGAGHSFTAAAVADDVQIRLDRLDRIIAVDGPTGLVRVGAGIRLRRLNTELEAHGLSMTNLGDIDAQTLAGAIATGTHGTGARFGGLATQVRGLQLVTGSGDIVDCSAQNEPDLFAAALVGVGAFGIVTEVTLQCEPLFPLHAVEAPMPLDRVLTDFDELADGNDHFEFYWFPHTTVALTKCNNRVAPGDGSPLPRWREWLDDDLLANGVFELVQRIATAAPSTISRANRIAAAALSARTFTDVSHRVFVSPRRVRFRETEWAVPRERTVDLVRGIKDWIEANSARISFPIEVRVAAADNIWLSTAHDRATGYVAVHQYHRVDHTDYFSAVEAIAKDLGGRPHWGKMHTLDARELQARYPHFADAMAVRDRVDPDRIFTNDYTQQIFGL